MCVMKQVNKLLVGCCLMMAGFAAQAAELQVQLEGVKHDKGVVKVGLYRDAATFRKENQAFQALQAPAKAGTVTIKFADIPIGQYAMLANSPKNGLLGCITSQNILETFCGKAYQVSL